MKYQLIEKDWYKRRVPNKQPTPKILNINIPDFEQIHNHMCTMLVEYDDGQTESLVARVIQNQVTKAWTVDGMKVAVKVEEGEET